MKKIFVNGRLLIGGQVKEGYNLVFDERIIGICQDYKPSDYQVIDLKGAYVSSGFIDIHIHGLKGRDVMDGDPESLKIMSDTLVETGVTSYLATTMTQDQKDIDKALEAVRTYRQEPSSLGANILGVHLEGPFINRAYKGAQNEAYIVLPREDMIEGYYDQIRLISLAPEVEGALDFCQAVKEKNDHIKFSIGHSAASYDKALEAYSQGFDSTTHLFNAMTGLHHRQPGIVGAVLKKKPYFEVIADKIHLHPGLYDILGDCVGLDKMILITDGMCACHMPPGTYALGGQEVVVDGESARLKNGSLAGSIVKMNEAIKNVLDHTPYNVSQVIQMATENPATMLGLDYVGQLKAGYRADFTIFDDKIQVQSTWIQGEEVFREDK